MSFEPYFLTFAPRLEERVWGGQALRRYGKELPPGKPIGESWEISDVEGKPSIVARGPYAGRSIRELVKSFPAPLTGGGRGDEPFPLLVKLLDAREWLSVQVHPSDADARRAGLTQGGKAEAWLILEATPQAELIHGLPPGVERAALAQRLAALGGSRLPPDEEKSLFQRAAALPGHVFNVPAGTVHALGPGIVLLEVQQTSDVTYRIYDWGRPRALEPRWAELASDPGPVPCPHTSIGRSLEAGTRPLLACDQFRLELVTLAGLPLPSSTRAGRMDGAFHILCGLEGTAVCAAREDRLELGCGQFALVPAALGGYTLAALGSAARVLRVLPGAP